MYQRPPSTSTAEPTQSTHDTTILVAATKEETKIAIDALLTTASPNPNAQVISPTGHACRKRTVTDYNKLINYGEDEELDKTVSVK